MLDTPLPHPLSDYSCVPRVKNDLAAAAAAAADWLGSPELSSTDQSEASPTDAIQSEAATAPPLPPLSPLTLLSLSSPPQNGYKALL
jgi:hypothetical protein